MSVYGRILLAGFGSALLLIGAFGFQYLGKLEPCVMCIWQRWPHAVAVVLSVLTMTVLWRVRRPLCGIGAAVLMASAGLGGFHVGVEKGWWQGPGTCSSTVDFTNITTEDLLAQLETATLVRCDDVVWDLFSISMAGWNAIISAGLALLWLFAALPRTPTPHKVPS